jgi:predicted nucleic acid-binding protein
MSYLIDTSVLLRLVNSSDALHATALEAIVKLHRAQVPLYLTTQSLIEFRNVATRPTQVSGLGLSSAEATVMSQVFETQFSLLDESPDFYVEWKRIVDGLRVIGTLVHEARIVAVCRTKSVDHILTFNTAYFGDMGSITAVDPRQL